MPETQRAAFYISPGVGNILICEVFIVPSASYSLFSERQDLIDAEEALSLVPEYVPEEDEGDRAGSASGWKVMVLFVDQKGIGDLLDPFVQVHNDVHKIYSSLQRLKSHSHKYILFHERLYKQSTRK